MTNSRRPVKERVEPGLQLLDRFPLLFWRAGLDAKCNHFNKAWLDFTGRTLEQELGDGWIEGIHADDRAACCEGYLEAFHARRPFLLEYRLRRQDGEYRWIIDRGSPFNDTAGEFAGYMGVCYDITPGKLAEEALRKSEKLFAGFMVHLQEFAWIKDLEGRYTYANDMLAKTGPYRGGWLGKTDAELWPPEIAAAVRASDETVIATGKALQTVESYTLAGVFSHVLVSRFPILGATGEVEMIGGTSIDVSESTRAREALSEQVMRNTTLMETSADSIYLLSENGDLLEANAAFLRRRGYTAADIGRLNVADWDAQWTRVELQERMRQLVDGSAVFETQHRCKDGSVFDVEASVSSVRLKGRPHFFSVSRDITERKRADQALRESEARFRQIAENIDEVFWVWTAERGKPRLLYVSRAYEVIWGRSCESLYASPPSWKEALHPADKKRVLSEIERLDIENPHALTYRIVRPDRSIRWISDRIFPVRDASGAVLRMAGILQDITESKQAEEALRTTNRQLQVLSRRRVEVQEEERRRISRELHDQIGQDLTAAKISLQSAKRSRKRENVLRELDRVMAGLDNILQQVRLMTMHLRPPALDDLGLVPALRLLLNGCAERSAWRAQFRGDADMVRPHVEVETACFRIALEALTNIQRHGQATTVLLELHKVDHSLRLLVRDDGIGFDVAEVEKQGEQDHLGLIGMRERAIAVGGEFSCKSSPGRGTEVQVSLPFYPVRLV